MSSRFVNCTAYGNPTPEPVVLTPLLTIQGDLSFRTIDVRVDHTKHSVGIYVPMDSGRHVFGCHMSVLSVEEGEAESVVIS